MWCLFCLPLPNRAGHRAYGIGQAETIIAAESVLPLITNHTILPRSFFLRWIRRNSNLHLPGYRNSRTTWSLIPLDCVLCPIFPSRSPKKVHATFTASSVGKKWNQDWHPPPYTISASLQFPTSKLELSQTNFPGLKAEVIYFSLLACPTRPDVQVTNHWPKDSSLYPGFPSKSSKKMQAKFTASLVSKECNQDWYSTQYTRRVGP